jgi:hypothetical protein
MECGALRYGRDKRIAAALTGFLLCILLAAVRKDVHNDKLEATSAHFRVPMLNNTGIFGE